MARRITANGVGLQSGASRLKKTTIDKGHHKPIYTREAARKRGWSEEEIERVFGKEKPKMVVRPKRD